MAWHAGDAVTARSSVGRARGSRGGEREKEVRGSLRLLSDLIPGEQNRVWKKKQSDIFVVGELRVGDWREKICGATQTFDAQRGEIGTIKCKQKSQIFGK